MTSKERVRLTIARREADRVPVDYECNAGIDARLKQHFGLKPDDNEGLRRALGVELIGNCFSEGPRMGASKGG